MNCVEKSIKDKWIPILRGERNCFGSDKDCACCEKYILDHCSGCPISKYSGQIYCNGTPYAAANHLFDWFIKGKVYDLHAECTAAANWEIEFLNEVLEEMEK